MGRIPLRELVDIIRYSMKSTIENWKNSIVEKGYYIGNINEIVDGDPLFDHYMDQIDRALGDDRYHKYRIGIPIRGVPGITSLAEIEERTKLIKENNLITTQQWHEISHWSPPENTTPAYEEFRTAIKKFVFEVYPQLNNDNIHFQDSWALYQEGDFIQFHTDGRNPGRLCVFLIYLSENQNDGGGRLIIQDKQTKIHTVEPCRGTFVVLDFTRFNLSHAVEVVKNNFKRYSFICFVYDKIEMKKRPIVKKENNNEMDELRNRLLNSFNTSRNENKE